MSRMEFERWMHFYERFPFDDMHRYHRPAALVARSMGGSDVGPLIDWLAHPLVKEHTDADLRTLKAFGFKPQDT
jgi:hypothetical protein